MGCENMGPLLYALVRFLKPQHVLEFGGGFTSIFIAQALSDNSKELKAGFGGISWYFKPEISIFLPPSQLHIVDNIAHEHTTAHRVISIAETLHLSNYLTLHNNDAFDPTLPQTLAPEPEVFDMIWIDIGAGDQITSLVDSWWERVSPTGGILAVHSTLTNSTMRAWLASMQIAQADNLKAEAEAYLQHYNKEQQSKDDGDRGEAERSVAANSTKGEEENSSSPLPAASRGKYGRFEILSLLEPHKKFQNSVSIFRRMDNGYTEPIYSKFA
jgi:predicted O-methyltransferase YrrM